MFAKHGRPKFCSMLEKYWSRFASSWDVLLHGSPAVDIYNGMKLAAGGELGMGVGEEDWGSSERDVLEDFARRTDGLVDVMVSRFGNASPLQQAKTSTDPKTLEVTESEPWMGSGRHVHAADGVVFSGLGAISRKSLRDVSHWIESLYSLGEYGYGVRDNPTADRRRRRKRNTKTEPDHAPSKTAAAPQNDAAQHAPSDSSPNTPRIPPPIVKTVEASLDKASAAVQKAESKKKGSEASESKPMLASLGDTEMWMKYMTLGYGTAWGGKKIEAAQPATEQSSARRTPSPEPMRYIEPAPDVDVAGERRKLQIQQENDGYFLIGLKGDMVDVDMDDNNEEGNWNNRIPLRTIHVEVDHPTAALQSTNEDTDATPLADRDLSFMTAPSNASTSKFTRIRPIVYVVSTGLTVQYKFTKSLYSTGRSSTSSCSTSEPIRLLYRLSTVTCTISSLRCITP